MYLRSGKKLKIRNLSGLAVVCQLAGPQKTRLKLVASWFQTQFGLRLLPPESQRPRFQSKNLIYILFHLVFGNRILCGLSCYWNAKRLFVALGGFNRFHGVLYPTVLNRKVKRNMVKITHNRLLMKLLSQTW